MSLVASQPALFEPGSAWHCGCSHDALGHVIEVASGQPFGDYLEEHIFVSLEMVDASFVAAENKADCFAALHAAQEGQPNLDVTALQPNMWDAKGKASTMQDGGGGLASAAADYLKFCQHLLRGGASATGARALKEDALTQIMTQNWLPGDSILTDAVFDMPFSWIAKSEAGNGRSSRGLGLTIALDDEVHDGKIGVNAGAYSWVGAAKTIMWVDPVADICAASMTSLFNGARC